MKNIKFGSILLAALLMIAMLLSGCSNASRSFYYSGNDDPLGLREIQGRIYEERAPQFSPSQGQSTAENETNSQNTEADTSNHGTQQNSSNQDDLQSQESSAIDQSDSGASEVEPNETSEGTGAEETSETDPFDSDEEQSATSKYDEEYCKEYYALGAQILDEVGWDLKAAYDWCVAISYFSGTPIDVGLGTRWYADLGFETHRGNCYTYAATLTVLARLLGYEARQVNGHIEGYEELHHSWVEIDIDGVTYTFDPEFEWERGKSGYLKLYGEQGIWALNNEQMEYMDDDPTDESLDAIEAAGWPRTGPYAEFIQYWEYQLYRERQNNQSSQESEESDPNGGCIGDDVPEQE